MITHRPTEECEQSRMFYYEYLVEPGALVDSPAGKHIGVCAYCQAEVEHLRDCLDQEATADPASSADTIRHLRLHLGWTDRPVTCAVVRPFLPALTDPNFSVTIPTPITVHIDHCESCRTNLETIRKMGLNSTQSCRLGQLLAESNCPPSEVCPVSCGQIEAIAQFDYASCTTEDLRHVCTCPECHRMLIGYRQESRHAMAESGPPSDATVCDSISAGDLFDFALPYGIRPDAIPGDSIRSALVSHLRECPKCMAQVIRLSSALDTLRQAHSSGIITRVSLDPTRDTSADDSSTGPYSGWPVKVSILKAEPPSERTTLSHKPETGRSPIPVRQTGKFSAFLRPWARPLAAAAAIVVFMYLIFGNPTAGAVELKELYQAVDAISNVYMRIFGSGQESPDPIQEILVCRSMGLKWIRNPEQSVLWDIPHASLTFRDHRKGTQSRRPLDQDMVEGLKQDMKLPPGDIMPFRTLKNAPRVLEWKQVHETESQTVTDTIQIYECTWADRSATGKEFLRRWRGYLDSTTMLPSRIEWWEKPLGETDFELTNVIVVEYPTEEAARILAGADTR